MTTAKTSWVSGQAHSEPTSSAPVSTGGEAAAPLLLEAESYLIGRKLRDLEALAARLRSRIRQAGPGASGRILASPPTAVSVPRRRR